MSIAFTIKVGAKKYMRCFEAFNGKKVLARFVFSRFSPSLSHRDKRRLCFEFQKSSQFKALMRTRRFPIYTKSHNESAHRYVATRNMSWAYACSMESFCSQVGAFQDIRDESKATLLTPSTNFPRQSKPPPKTPQSAHRDKRVTPSPSDVLRRWPPLRRFLHSSSE